MNDQLDNIAPDVDIAAEMAKEPESEPQSEPAKEPVQQDMQLEPAKEPATEPKQEPKQEPPSPPAQKMVPLAALHEERIRRREIERQYAEQKKAWEDQVKQFQNPVPKFEDDPANNLRHETETTKARLEQIERDVQQTRQEREARTFEQQIAVNTQAAEQAFSKVKPEYFTAVQYLQTIADKNLQLMGMDDPAARQAQIRQDAMAMSLKALQAGKNPAEVAFQLAVNYGFKVEQADVKNDPQKKIATLQQGQRAAASMPSGGGKTAPMSIEALAQLDDDEFNKAIDDPAVWKKLISQA